MKCIYLGCVGLGWPTIETGFESCDRPVSLYCVSLTRKTEIRLHANQLWLISKERFSQLGTRAAPLIIMLGA